MSFSFRRDPQVHTQVEIPSTNVARAEYVPATWIPKIKDGHFSVSILTQDALATPEFLTDRLNRINAVAGIHMQKYSSFGALVGMFIAAGIAVLSKVDALYALMVVPLLCGSVGHWYYDPVKRINKLLKEFNETDQGNLVWSLQTREVASYDSKTGDTTINDVPQTLHIVRING
ncbi:UNVERIFIED_CONTAM: hypothetical protein HDU68_003530 [Siphonaria sp. JEL0065]|nr:hypothetical protein HDU68_003530 [Siphonaria sp. JEL0065]